MATLRSLRLVWPVLAMAVAAACSNPFSSDTPRDPVATAVAAPTLATSESADGEGDDQSTFEDGLSPSLTPSSDTSASTSTSEVLNRRDFFEAGLYRTLALTDFSQLSGLSVWIPDAEQRMQDAVWGFEDDGTFTFDPPESRAGLFPLTGTWSWDQDVAVFNASAEVDGVGGATQTLLYGEFRAEPDGVIALQGTWITTTDADAEIGQTDFSAERGSAYDFTSSLATSADGPEEQDPDPTTIEREDEYAFSSPSGNIVCAMDAATGVTCKIVARSWDPADVSESCEDEDDFDGVAALTVDGVAWSCDSSLEPANNENVLAYNGTAVVGAFECESQRTGMTCTDGDGRGFFLSRARGDLLRGEDG